MPTGFDIQKKYDALKADLSAAAVFAGAPRGASIAVREPNNSLSVRQLSADATGVIDKTEAEQMQLIVDALKVGQDNFNTAKVAYDLVNTSENIGNLSSALGEYFTV